MRSGWTLKGLFTRDPARLAPARQRDLRLDFFRGLALIYIFLDHIPSNLLNWLTVRNYGFSDATEIFIFISGYSAVIAYGGVMRRAGIRLATMRVLRRCWQLYVAHIVTFLIFTAQIAYVAHRFNNPMFAEEMQIMKLYSDPDITLLQALLLKFRPANLDILPLYIVLLLAFAPILWALERAPAIVLGGSFALYVLTLIFNFNLPSYPPGEGWYFNPFAWQFLFVIGALLGRQHGSSRSVVPYHPVLVGLAGGYLLFAFLLAMTWNIPQLQVYVPIWLTKILYPISKTNLDPLRLLHFLALAYLVERLVYEDSAFLRWKILQPVLRCGQHSLYVFCTGVVLSFSGHFFLVEIDGGLPAQLLVSFVGIGLMIALAYLLQWYRGADRAYVATRSAPKAAGGE
jgi:hypothetical protein